MTDGMRVLMRKYFGWSDEQIDALPEWQIQLAVMIMEGDNG